MTDEMVRSLLILAPWGMDTGFRLGGAPVRTVSNEERFNRAIEEALQRDDLGLLALPDVLEKAISRENRKALDKRDLPMVVFYPFPEEWSAAEETEEEVQEIVKRAIGYRLRIKQ